MGKTYSRGKDPKHFIVLSNLSFPLFFLLLTPVYPDCHSVRWKLGVRETFRSMSSGVWERAGSLPWYSSSNEAFCLNISGLMQRPLYQLLPRDRGRTRGEAPWPSSSVMPCHRLVQLLQFFLCCLPLLWDWTSWRIFEGGEGSVALGRDYLVVCTFSSWHRRRKVTGHYSLLFE